jgi:methyltransferase (TIGR00027 family)
VVARGRYTEDRVADSVSRGTRQYMILGAGLDSFAYRSELAGQIRVFEVDHPATQQWKRQRLSAAHIPIPECVTYIPVDFETDALAERLIQGGYDPAQPAIVSWLGVTVYLTRLAISETLAILGRLAAGTEIVLDYLVPAEMRDSDGRTYAELVMPIAAQQGEPWLTFFTPDEMTVMLNESGFDAVAHVQQHDVLDTGQGKRNDSLRPSNLSLLAHASVSAPA